MGIKSFHSVFRTLLGDLDNNEAFDIQKSPKIMNSMDISLMI